MTPGRQSRRAKIGKCWWTRMNCLGRNLKYTSPAKKHQHQFFHFSSSAIFLGVTFIRKLHEKCMELSALKFNREIRDSSCRWRSRMLRIPRSRIRPIPWKQAFFYGQRGWETLRYVKLFEDATVQFGKNCGCIQKAHIINTAMQVRLNALCMRIAKCGCLVG